MKVSRMKHDVIRDKFLSELEEYYEWIIIDLLFLTE